jgi:predicted ATPase
MSASAELQRLQRDWASAGHQANGWPQFLVSVQIAGLRGWTGEQVEFRFPIVAVAGENGSGKSTVLKVAAAAYANVETAVDQYTRTLNPDDFFPSTQWESVAGVRLTYVIRQGDKTTSYILRKPSDRWRGMPERATRRLYFLDISRTQPINTLIGYGKIAKASAFGDVETELVETERRRLSRVLRRDYTAGRMVAAGAASNLKTVGVLTRDGNTYSNFHQGAGEDSSADLIALLQEAPNNALIIIDEVEASLHPRAQRRLIAELCELARRKRLQFILSTHSPFVLEQLPEIGCIYLQSNSDGGRTVLYGVSPEYALTMMDDEHHPDLRIYAEDERAAYLGTALVAHEDDLLNRVKFVAAGAANVVKALGHLAATDRLPGRSIGLLDGDEPTSEGCINLPGQSAPELEVFNGILAAARWADLGARLGVPEGVIEEAVRDAMNLENHHEWPLHVADTLRGAWTRRKVWEEFADFYAGELISAADRDDFAQRIKDLIAS